MRGDAYLTRSAQYERVHGQGRAWAYGPILMKAAPNGLGASRYGFSVGRRVGNAVTRNRVKRRLREILRSKLLVPGWDIVFIARTSAAMSSYANLENSVTSALTRAGLLSKVTSE